MIRERAAPKSRSRLSKCENSNPGGPYPIRGGASVASGAHFPGERGSAIISLSGGDLEVDDGAGRKWPIVDPNPIHDAARRLATCAVIIEELHDVVGAGEDSAIGSVDEGKLFSAVYVNDNLLRRTVSVFPKFRLGGSLALPVFCNQLTSGTTGCAACCLLLRGNQRGGCR